MKYLKTKNISRYNISDESLMYNTYGRVTIESTNSLRIPKGTTAQRPNGAVVSNLNGSIRYNTDTNSLEGYIDGAWETIRASGASAIDASRFPANGTETTFGPLTASFVSAYSRSDYNLIVLVDNVLQIGRGVNYTIVKRESGVFVQGAISGAAPFSASGPGTYTDGEYYIQFPQAVPPFNETGISMYVTVFYGFGN
jgi:hypothetical protein